MSSPTRYLAPDAAQRGGDDPIFALNAEAGRRRAAGESILNATLGALLEDDGSLAIMPSVVEAIRAVDPRAAAAYAPIAGDAPFLAGVIGDLFGSGPLASQAVAVATPGGSGALHLALATFLDPEQAVVVPSYYWGPYATMAAHVRRRLCVFPMFDARGGFDLAAFEQALEERMREQGRALAFLNFPCNNPTGYALDAAEWQAVAEIVERASARGPVSVLIDLAYCRFGGSGADRWQPAAERLAGRALVLAAWTASKSFAQYGARVGALVAVHPDPEERRRIQAALSFACRGTWSNCNHLGILAIARILGSEEARERATAERARLVALLDERVRAFNRAATGLAYPRYEGGFFVSVFAPRAEDAARHMRTAGVFVVPIDGALRIALSSTPAHEVPRLVGALRTALSAT